MRALCAGRSPVSVDELGDAADARRVRAAGVDLVQDRHLAHDLSPQWNVHRVFHADGTISLLMPCRSIRDRFREQWQQGWHQGQDTIGPGLGKVGVRVRVYGFGRGSVTHLGVVEAVHDEHEVEGGDVADLIEAPGDPRLQR